MSLVPCPECRTEISSKAQFCPKCGYPFDRDLIKQEENDSTKYVRIKRPFVIVFGIIMCIVGFGMLFGRHMFMFPLHLRGFGWPLIFQPHRMLLNFYRSFFITDSNFFGVVLLVLGILLLVFCSSKLKKA
jgi:hypothetical protein